MDILIDESDTFLDFHTVLQKNLNYDPTQLASFFITNENWEKLREITLIDMQEEDDQLSETMENALLGNNIYEKNQRLLYIFDFFSERAFFIELMNTFDRKSLNPTPLVTSLSGTPPPQLQFMTDDANQSGYSDDCYPSGSGEPDEEDYDQEFPESDYPFDFPPDE
ncbi:MAG: hypothetical protein JXR52_02880 [Bacteroidales bacterium]|nr:hypothetical protein [Bacteroidales bacterium]MBN2697744.1 hypothetical protein [Bacteroidales bacterium]